MKDKNTDDTSKKHLPLFGVGPVIVYGQFFITGMAIVLSYIFDWSFAVRRHIVGGANRTLISVKTPSRSCRIGT